MRRSRHHRVFVHVGNYISLHPGSYEKFVSGMKPTAGEGCMNYARVRRIGREGRSCIRTRPERNIGLCRMECRSRCRCHRRCRRGISCIHHCHQRRWLCQRDIGRLGYPEDAMSVDVVDNMIGGTYRSGGGASWTLNTRGSANTRIWNLIIRASDAAGIVSGADQSGFTIFTGCVSEDFVD